MRFSDKLAKMRKANNLSQEQLAEQLGVTRQSISKWESGDSYPDMARIIEICKILNCKLNDIMDDGLLDETEAKEENVITNDINTVKKYLDGFLAYIAKTCKMFMHMSFKDKLKTIIEMAFTGLVLVLVGSLAYSGIESFLYRLFSVVKNAGTRNYLIVVLSSVALAAIVILAVIVFFHIFKIRYLDYYVVITDSNAEKPSVEEPIEENRSELIADKEPKIIIRDPKHSHSAFLDGLAVIFSIIMKFILILLALPIIVAVLFAIAGIFFCIFHKGMAITSIAVVLLGATIFAAMLLLAIFNLVFNHKQQYKALLLMFFASMLVCGIGTGSFGDSLTKINIIEEEDYEQTSQTMVISDVKDEDHIFIGSDDVQFLINDSKDDIEIEFIYPKQMRVMGNVDDSENGSNYYYYLGSDDISEIRQIMQDLSKDQIRRTYYNSDCLKAIVTCSTRNRELFEYMG